MSHVVGRLSQRLGGAVTCVKIDTEQNPALASRYKVQALPTLVLFKDGKPIDKVEVPHLPMSSCPSQLDRTRLVGASFNNCVVSFWTFTIDSALFQVFIRTENIEWDSNALEPGRMLYAVGLLLTASRFANHPQSYLQESAGILGAVQRIAASCRCRSTLDTTLDIRRL